MLLFCKKVRDGYIVNRKGGTYEQHSHFSSEMAGRRFIKLINKGLLPKSPYYLQAAKRVLLESEFNRLKVQQKTKYVNVQRGVRNVN